MSFDNLGLSDKVVEAVKAVGYTEPTPIQEAAIPLVLSGRDVLGLAQTGTGKTASFTLPMLTRLERGRARARMPRTLILEPTRELAAQVHENFENYGVNHKLTVALLIGGVSFDEQDKKITRGADVLIATPGRLLDHFERGRLLLTGVEIVVIDEADRMLDMGFIPDIERIIKLIPFTRQTLLFSATMPPEISRLADQFLQNPERIEVSKRSSTADTVKQLFVSSGSKPSEKRATLRNLINGSNDLKNAIIFCNRKRDIATLQRSLERHGFSAGALHGDMDQHSRLKTLEGFRNNEITLLVASDVAARGLDIPDVSHIFNFDVPSHAEDYVHRIGRTGRAGRSGSAFTIATSADKKYVAAIENMIGEPVKWASATAVQSGEAVADDAPADVEANAEKKPRRRRRTRRDDRKSEAEAAGSDDQTVEAAADDTKATGEASETAADPVAEVAEATDDKPKRSRNRRGGRGKSEASADAAEETPRGRGKSRAKEGSRKGEVGFGDLTPAFMLRPVKAAIEQNNKAEAAEAQA